jgi:hypothetical protein
MQTLVDYMRQRPITKIEELLGKVVQSSSAKQRLSSRVGSQRTICHSYTMQMAAAAI